MVVIVVVVVVKVAEIVAVVAVIEVEVVQVIGTVVAVKIMMNFGNDNETYNSRGLYKHMYASINIPECKILTILLM